MTLTQQELARRKKKRTGRRPYIAPTSPEFLAALPDAKRLLDESALGADGRPRKKRGRPPTRRL